MPENKLVVVHDADSDQLTVELHFHETLRAQPVPFTAPLDLRERALLRWYLEEYLSFPVGAEEDRARDVERLLPEWGARLFEPLFGVGAPGRDLYIRARDRGFNQLKFEIRYTSGSIRNVPWELLHDPEKGFFLAHQFAAFSRRQLSGVNTVYEPREAGEELRLLVVTARPYGIDLDVPYRTVTGPMMEILRQPRLRDRIYVEMLRPPTFEAFQKAVRRKNETGQPFFDVVHFDGHGGFGLPDPEEIVGDDEEKKPIRVLDLFEGPAGMLVFETPEGTEDRIAVQQLKEVVGEHRVPLVVLNACRSGMEALEDPQTTTLVEMLQQSPQAMQEVARLASEEGVDLATILAGQGEKVHSVAGSILDGGASAVVSMGFIVRAKAAAIFMRGFYGALLEGGTAAAAVSAGRVALMTEPARPTQFGELPLQDWMVPVYSERFDLRLFAESTPGSRARLLLEQLKHRSAVAEERRAAEAPLPDRPRFGFVGRDREILRIERVLLDSNLAGLSLVGLGGNGKTTLAVGTARWMVATHAPQVAGGVFFHQFLERDEAGNALHPNLAALLRTVGRTLFSDDEFLPLLEKDQRRVVAAHLRTTPCLLVLDNAETVAGLGEAPALLSEEERAEFVTFLREVCVPNGSTRVLVTSRREEPWLGLNLAHLEVGGLDREAAEELAQQVLLQSMEAVDLDSKRRDPAWTEGYRQLLKTLGGHPMALQVVLPHLARRTPDEVLAAYSEGSSSLDGELSGPTDRERTLRGSLDFSMSTLSERTRRLLPFLAYFREWVDPDHLAFACQGDEVPERLRGADDAVWMETLVELQSTGLVTRLGEHPRSPFALHSLLPWYLASELEKAEDAEALEAQFRRFAAGFAGATKQSFETGGTAAQAVFLFRQNAATFRHALDLARRRGRLEEVMLLYQCLYDLMVQGGQARQAAQMLEALSEEFRPEGDLDAESTAGRIWQGLQERRAWRSLGLNQLDEAESGYREIVEAYGESSERVVTAFHQLGILAEVRRDFDRAERWYKKSLEIELQHDNKAGAAITYHQLGYMAQKRRDFDNAERWHGKSLELSLQIGNKDGIAITYHHFGMVAQERREFDEAERWYKKSLELKLQLDDKAGTAIAHHQLGMLAEERRDFDEAERWYKKSLKLKIELELNDSETGVATTYHQLGIVAQERGDFDEAERWYKKSLEVNLQLGNKAGAAISYHQLGIVAQERRDFDEAERWYEKSLELKRQLGNLHGAASTQAQMGLVQLQRGKGESGVDPLIAALRQFQATQDPHNVLKTLQNIRNLGLRRGLIDRPLVETLWQKHFQAPIPDDIAEILFAEDDAPPTERPSLPDEMRQALVGMLQAGLSVEQVVEVLERGSGQRFAPDVIEWLRSELTVDENREEDETE